MIIKQEGTSQGKDDGFLIILIMIYKWSLKLCHQKENKVGSSCVVD